MAEPLDITHRLRTEFRVRSWWPGMDSFDTARGETEPHPLAEEAAHVIEELRRHLRAVLETSDYFLNLDYDDHLYDQRGEHLLTGPGFFIKADLDAVQAAERFIDPAPAASPSPRGSSSTGRDPE